jgi:hypothetical protein
MGSLKRRNQVTWGLNPSPIAQKKLCKEMKEKLRKTSIHFTCINLDLGFIIEYLQHPFIEAFVVFNYTTTSLSLCGMMYK